MPCPTCSHTMQALPREEGATVFWCPRCGTIKRDHPGNDTSEAPKLVSRCRAFGEALETATYLGAAPPRSFWIVWQQLGIAESIRPVVGGDGTGGQDRESYGDDQDRDCYVADEGTGPPV